MILCLSSLIGYSQVVSYRTTGFYTSQNTSYGWTNWSSREYSNLLLQIDWNQDLIYIQSPQPQLYKIVQTVSNGYDRDNDYVAEYRFVGQDYDRGTMRLVIRQNGQSQIYIIFNNIRWCYDVVKL